MAEYQEQKAVFEWAELMKGKHPQLEWMYAIPNGQYRKGQRPEAGMKAGVPDICLPPYLYIELKSGKNKPTENQKRWIEGLENTGCIARVCYGADEAIELIKKYLGGL